jgi:radical SAM protein with 4Fe4S-binding SPASM domain
MTKLTESNIFPVPVGNYFGITDENLFLVYAPLSDNALVATPDNVAELETYLADPSLVKNEDIAETMESLLDNDSEKFAPLPSSPASYARLAILPNNVCNFNCSYCYSAKGRSGKVIDRDVLKSMLDHFIDPQRIAPPRNLLIAILGGGEPFLNWELVKFTIGYSTELAAKHRFTLGFSLVTNGSIINDDIISLLKTIPVTLSISFEILEEIQNGQRGNYALVCKNIDKLIANGVVPNLRSTITSENVKLQEKMVQEVQNRFPALTDIMFEAVTDADSFNSPDEIREFYDQYIEHFFAAHALGQELGKKVDCSAARNFYLLEERFCPGEFALTPDGDISICTRITSPLDTGYDDCVYGKVDGSGKIQIDFEKFLKLTGDNVYSREKCRDCFAKWHCGGGCLAQKYVYNEDVLDLICDFTRSFTKRMILVKLEKQYKEYYDVSLKEAVMNNENIQA